MIARDEILRMAGARIRVCPFIFRATTESDHRELVAAENVVYRGLSTDFRCSDYIDLVALLAVRDESWPSDAAEVREYIETIVGHWFATEALKPRYRGSALRDLENWQYLQARYRGCLITGG